MGYFHRHRLRLQKENPYREPAGSPGGVGGQYAKKPTDTKAFKDWFGASKVVDAKGNPLVLYHGTTGDFDEFDLSKSNIESNFGAGIYATDSVDDANINYAGFGPDLTNKLDTLRERIVDEFPDYSAEQIDAIAKKRLSVEHEGAILPVYAKLENPFVLAGEGQTYLDFEEPFDEETEEFGEPKGKLVSFLENLRYESSGYEGGDIGDLVNKVYEVARDNSGISAAVLDSLIRGDETFGYFADPDTGALASTEIYRKALERTGFDGVIDETVSSRFRAMEGLEGAKHFIIFNPKNVKSAIGNSGSFNPETAKILKNLWK